MSLTTKEYIGISAGAIVGIVALLFFFPAAPDSQPSQSVVRVVEVKSSQVRVEARLEKNRIEDSSDDLLHIDVLNDSEQSLALLKLSLTTPQFVAGNESPTCRHLDGSSSPDKPLGAHQRCEFQVPLSASVRSGSYGITSVVEWQQTPLPVPAQAAPAAGVVTSAPVPAEGLATLTLGPVTIDRSFGAASWTRLARRLAALLKDLTLPIILVGLGAFFTNRQTRQENERKTAEAEREIARTDQENARQDARLKAEKQIEQARIDADHCREIERRAAEIKQVERQEVHRLLLGRVMELAEQHYLPFVSHSRLILMEAEKIKNNAPDAAPDKLFFNVLLLLKRMEIFRSTKGGLFFSTRGGEHAVGAAWFLIKFTIYGVLGDADLSVALKRVELAWDYAVYRDELNSLTTVWVKFQQWLAEPETSNKGAFRQLLGTIDAFQAIMLFEADKALSAYWYDESSTLVFLLAEPTTLYELPSTDPTLVRQAAELEALLNTSYNRSVNVIKLT
jgi:hypothetical protein